MIIRDIVATLCFAAGGLFPVALLAQEDLSATGSEVRAALPPSSALSAEDSEFLAKAVKVSARELLDADVVARNSQRPTVKSTAREIAANHVRSREQLEHLVQRKGVAVTDEAGSLAPGQQRSDASMIAALLQMHEAAVASFHRESVRGTDPDVRKFAIGALPALQRDLASLRTLQNTLPANEST